MAVKPCSSHAPHLGQLLLPDSHPLHVAMHAGERTHQPVPGLLQAVQLHHGCLANRTCAACEPQHGIQAGQEVVCKLEACRQQRLASIDVSEVAAWLASSSVCM